MKRTFIPPSNSETTTALWCVDVVQIRNAFGHLNHNQHLTIIVFKITRFHLRVVVVECVQRINYRKLESASETTF